MFFRYCRFFFLASWFSSNAFLISLYFGWVILLLSVLSTCFICSEIFVFVVLQNLTISLISLNENLFSFWYQLSKNSWSWFPIVGSSWRFKPWGTTLSVMHLFKNEITRTLLGCRVSDLVSSRVIATIITCFLSLIKKTIFHLDRVFNLTSLITSLCQGLEKIKFPKDLSHIKSVVSLRAILFLLLMKFWKIW